MYTLTLTSAERSAFDWVGDRYGNGDDMSDLLCQCLPEDREWADGGEITFNVPEWIAWSILAISEEDDGNWTCFSPDLAGKMRAFLDGIV